MTVLILVVALLVGFIGLIATASRHLAGRAITGGMVRRGFHYVVLYGLVVLVANGAVDLLAWVLGERHGDATVFAQALTAVMLGIPAALALMWWSYRLQRSHAEERRSLVFRAYLTAGSLTGAALTAGGLSAVLTTAIGSAQFNATALSGVVVWGLVWAGHWLVMWRSSAGPNVAHLVLGSAIGLVLAAVGLANLLESSLELLAGNSAAVGPWNALGAAVGLLAGGGLLWSMYWLFGAFHAQRGAAWYAHVVVLGVAGGLCYALVGAQALLWRGLVQRVGEPASFTSWSDWPGEAAALVVGATVWWYHRALLLPEHDGPAYRVKRYVVAGIGVVATTVGIGFLVVALIEVAVASGEIGYTSGNTLLGAVAMLMIAVPVWWLSWRTVLHAVAQDPATELAARSRRIFLVAVLGVAGVVAMVALIFGVTDVLRDVVEAQVDWSTLHGVRREIGYLVAASAVMGYHLAVLRQDVRHVR